jgi:hypothetical protein
MLRLNTVIITSALLFTACGIEGPEAAAGEATDDAVIVRRIPPRQLKMQRLVEGPEFQDYQVRHALRVAHYEGLATQDDLATQVLFQLYRGEHLRDLDEKEDAEEAKIATRRSIQPTTARRGFLPQARSSRRHFYKTPQFARLKANRQAAVADIGTALGRVSIPRSERVELLRLLHALVKDNTDPAVTRHAKSTFLAYALRAFEPRTEDYTPHLAFAYYGGLETDDATRASNGARFVRTPHSTIPPHLARRIYSDDTFSRARALTRVVGASR